MHKTKQKNKIAESQFWTHLLHEQASVWLQREAALLLAGVLKARVFFFCLLTAVALEQFFQLSWLGFSSEI